MIPKIGQSIQILDTNHLVTDYCRGCRLVYTTSLGCNFKFKIDRDGSFILKSVFDKKSKSLFKVKQS